MTATADDGTALLERYRPFMQYDSHEPYFADFAGIISDRPSNTLRTAAGQVLATATAQQGLLGLLHPGAYPPGAGGGTPAATDHLSETGHDYQAQAAQMHALPAYANRVHGRVAVDAGGIRWLQYWFIMYYDDPGLLGTDIGVHEGDLEMIELALGADGTPVTAVYAHHRSGYRVAYDEVETAPSPDGPAPVVFSARGSHASMLRAGHQLAGSVVPDRNDARGPRVRPAVVVLDRAQTPWAWWPGSWGATRAPNPTLGSIGVEANSPTAFTAHPAWNGPAAFAASCQTPGPLPPAGAALAPAQAPPPAPQITVARAGDELRVAYDAGRAAAAGADRLTVAARPSGADGPARTVTVDLSQAPSGTVSLPVAPGDASHDVHASARRADGPSSDTATVTATRRPG